MNVGDTVAIKWLDSGLGCPSSSLEDALSAELVTPTVYGLVVHLDEIRVVIAQEIDNEGEHGDFGVYWVPAILEVTVLVAATDEVDEIIAEVDSQLLRPASLDSHKSTRKIKGWDQCACQGCVRGEKWCAFRDG